MRHLENEIPAIPGALMRAGRSEAIQAEVRRHEGIKSRKRDLELLEPPERIREEEKRVAELDSWATSWARAKQYRVFIDALERAWTDFGYDLGADSEKRTRILWMKQQADRGISPVPVESSSRASPSMRNSGKSSEEFPNGELWSRTLRRRVGGQVSFCARLVFF